MDAGLVDWGEALAMVLAFTGRDVMLEGRCAAVLAREGLGVSGLLCTKDGLLVSAARDGVLTCWEGAERTKSVGFRREAPTFFAGPQRPFRGATFAQTLRTVVTKNRCPLCLLVHRSCYR